MKIKITLLVGMFLVLAPFQATLASDPYQIKQWYLPSIKADQAWNITRGSSSVVVAVIDTGVDLDHRDLRGNIWTNPLEIPDNKIDDDRNGYVDDVQGWNFVENNGNPNPVVSGDYATTAVSHGTFIAGIVAAVADNGVDIKGIASNVRIMPIRALDSNGEGIASDVARAINYAVDNGANVINLSFVGDTSTSALKQAVINAYNKGVLVVAAAGNSSGSSGGRDLTNDPAYPICYDKGADVNRVLGVVATDKQNRVTTFTNYGGECVDLAAPGTDITSLAFNNGSTFSSYVQESWQGSSFSAAIVTGAVALLKSYNNSITPSQIISVLQSQSSMLFVPDEKYRGKVGDGVLDIKRALDFLVNGGLPAVPVSTPATGTTVTTPSTGSNSSNNNSGSSNSTDRTPTNPAPNNNTTPNTATTPNSQTPVVPPAPAPIISNSKILVSAKSGFTSVIYSFNSKLEREREFTVFNGSEFKGINFTVADVNGDKGMEVVTGAVQGNTPFVRVLDLNGNMLYSFLAFEESFKGGVRVGAGDVDGDKQVEIIAVPDSGRAPVVRIFSLDGKLKKEFLAFTKNYTKGLNLAVGDADGDGKAEIVIAPHEDIMGQVKYFDAAGKMKKSLLPYSVKFKGGVNIALGDINGDGWLDLVTGAGKTGGPHVQAFEYSGVRITSFMAYNANFTGGVEVAAVDFDADGKADIVTVPQTSGGPHVKVWKDKTTTLLAEFFPFANSFTNGVNVGGF